MNHLVERFLNNPSYLDNGAGFLAKRWNESPVTVKHARIKARKLIKDKEVSEKPFRRMFFDIETSPCLGTFWKPGFKVKLDYKNVLKDAAVIGVSWKWEEEDQVYNLRWKNDSPYEWDDKEMLKEFVKELNKADEVVAHNGDRFDIKWLRTRCLYHGIEFPVVIKSLDTLPKVKYYFRFPTNRLNDIGEYLGIGEKLDTNYGLWRDVCIDNDKKALDYMMEYCDRDVVLLEDIYHYIQSYIDTNTHVGVHQGKEKWSCPSCGSENVDYVKPVITKAGTIQRIMRCNDCGTTYKISNTAYKQYIDAV